jgi:hypothetical protein
MVDKAAGFLANLLREARSKRKYAIMRTDPFTAGSVYIISQESAREMR